MKSRVTQHTTHHSTKATSHHIFKATKLLKIYKNTVAINHTVEHSNHGAGSQQAMGQKLQKGGGLATSTI